MVATGTNMTQCLTEINRELRKEEITEDDVITLHCETDDSGVSAWAFYWK